MTTPTNVHTIEIDMNKKCSRCEEPGATTNGLCLDCITKGIKPQEYIVVDCKIESARTDWEKKELKISLAATHEDAEYEAERLGEIARLEIPAKVLIYQVDESLDRAVEVTTLVDAVKLDYKTDKVTITLTVSRLADELISKALRLGVMAHMEFPCTARFEPAQGRLL